MYRAVTKTNDTLRCSMEADSRAACVCVYPGTGVGSVHNVPRKKVEY